MARFDATFAALKALLAPYEPRLHVNSDAAATYMLEGEYNAEIKRPMFFAGVRAGKAYVSFYLMPVYSHPELMGRISDGLRRRLHGKSCFNFTRPEPELFDELRELVRSGFSHYERLGHVK
jgi:hypothetical protein